MTKPMARVVTAALLLAATRPAAAQTLREVLHEFELPRANGGPLDLDRRITSYSAENWADLFVIAFYPRGAEPTAIPDTLRVSTFDWRTGNWAHAALERRRTSAPAWDIGSVVGIQHAGDRIFLDTHTNPSAGTVVVLTRGLKPVAALDGWLLRLLPSGKAFYHRSVPHFSASHPAELWTWDPVTGVDARVYPVEPYDSIRTRYIAEARAIYRRVGEAWFRQHSRPMDAERFGSSIRSRIRADAAGSAVVFLAQFGEEDDSPARTPLLDVVVSCRAAGTARVRCREVELASLQARYPGWSTSRILDQLLADLAEP
ncbi:MAG TPA: hypothetical protein VFU23_02385 [Gemmatimonadales bacterium]|nr:hypothetical protein [Gemmatimonadales bacterium]